MIPKILFKAVEHLPDGRIKIIDMDHLYYTEGCEPTFIIVTTSQLERLKALQPGTIFAESSEIG